MLENKREVIAFLLRCPNCGERGSMREKGIDGRHAEADSLGLGNQPGTTPFVNASAFPSTDGETSYKPTCARVKRLADKLLDRKARFSGANS